MLSTQARNNGEGGMPSISWNRVFAREVQQFAAEDSHYGDRWGDPETSYKLTSIRSRFLTPFIKSGQTALEIGSGGGRFTQYLLPFNRVYCVDINKEMFDYLRKRFPSANNLEFITSGGCDIPDVPPDSVDFVWSFGTFVHIEEPELVGYLKAFKPLLKSDARLTLHYTDKNKPEAQRQKVLAQMTRERMHELLADQGYRIIDEDADTLDHSNVISFQIG
jgi:SAM-dependent methyltransferase